MSDEKGYEGYKRGEVDAPPAKMSAIQISEFAGYQDFDTSKLTFSTDTTTPTAAAGEVLIRVLASSVNPIDWKCLSGVLKAHFPVALPNFIPGFDVAGVVVAVGEGVERLKAGDAVWTDVIRRSDKGLLLGAYSQYVAVPQTKVSFAPKNLSPIEAATIPLAALTSFQMLQKVKAGKGTNILVLGASGGTGSMAVQIAKALGCNVTATCSGKNSELVKGLGADSIINYREQKWQDEAKNVDALVDCVGEKEVCKNANTVLKDGGQFVTIANMAVSAYKFERGVEGSFLLTNSESVSDLDQLKEWVESGALKPVIAKTYPLEKIGEAFKESISGRVAGKLAIEVP